MYKLVLAIGLLSFSISFSQDIKPTPGKYTDHNKGKMYFYWVLLLEKGGEIVTQRLNVLHRALTMLNVVLFFSSGFFACFFSFFGSFF